MRTALANSAAAFERLYRQSPDPWSFATSAYEQGRYRATLRALKRQVYGRAFEPGCSVGALTAQLARRCRAVIATDIAPSAVQRAQERCRAFEQVEIFQADLADGPAPGPFDLIVLSEIGYYFSKDRLRAIGRALAAQLALGGELIAVHWLGRSPDHVLHGDTVHEVLRSHLPLQWIKGWREPEFRIDTWIRA
jgi:SAM-dependent methyltransferase